MRSSGVICVVVAAGAFLIGLSSAHGATLNFDDLANQSYESIATGYGGLNWSNFVVLDTSWATATNGPTGYQYAAVSGTDVALNAGGNEAVTSGSEFTFSSAYFTAAWNDGLDVNVTGYHSGIQVHQASFQVNTSGPILETFNWTNIDSLTFVSSGGTPHSFPGHGSGTQFAMDNFTITQSAATVPEPTTLPIILAGGTLACGLFRRRHRSASTSST